MNAGKTLAVAATGIAALLVAAVAPQFEVASVKKVNANAVPDGSKSQDGRGGGGAPFQIDHGRFSYTATFYELVLRAYGIRGCRPQSECALVTGGPDWTKQGWIRNDRFEIQAKTPAGTPDYTALQFLGGQATQVQLMLQALLTDRFNLKLHREQRELSVYALTVAKNGPRANLKKATGSTTQLKDGSMVKDTTIFFRSAGANDPSIHLTVRNRPLREFVDTLSSLMDRRVLDRTGLDGEFDFEVDYEKDPDATGPASLVGSTMISAFQEQLGLKLEATKAPVEVLVIDHVEQPSEN